jgi:hypothetical protein
MARIDRVDIHDGGADLILVDNRPLQFSGQDIAIRAFIHRILP